MKNLRGDSPPKRKCKFSILYIQFSEVVSAAPSAHSHPNLCINKTNDIHKEQKGCLTRRHFLIFLSRSSKSCILSSEFGLFCIQLCHPGKRKDTQDDLSTFDALLLCTNLT